MRKIVLTFGLIAGFIMSVPMVATLPFIDSVGFDRGMVIGYTGMVAGFLLVYFGVRAYRDQVAGGQVRFGRAFAVGMAIVLVAIVVYVVTWQIVYWVFIPDFADKFSAHAIAQLRKAGAPEAVIAAKAKEMADFAVMYRNPLVNVGLTLLEPTPVGVVFAAVSAWLVSRRRGVPVPAV